MFETTIHWVQGIGPHRLGLMARPRGGESLAEEVLAWKTASIHVVVSLLEAEEVRELELKAERLLCAEAGIEFKHFSVPDRGLPWSMKEADALIDELHANLMQSRAIAIHCRAGIGRTGLVAGCLLHRLQVPLSDIFHLLSRSRGYAMPDTAAQAEWVEAYARRWPKAAIVQPGDTV